MKKLFILATCVLLSVCLVSCSSARKQKSVPMVEGETEVSIPLSGAEYQSDAANWRSVQLGTSSDVSMAKKIALQHARQELASEVNSQVKGVMENYGESLTEVEDATYEKIYQELVRTVVDQQLHSAVMVGEKLYRLADGKYRYHVCLEMNKEALKEQLAEELAKDKRLKLQFNREQFKKVFDQELGEAK